MRQLHANHQIRMLGFISTTVDFQKVDSYLNLSRKMIHLWKLEYYVFLRNLTWRYNVEL